MTTRGHINYITIARRGYEINTTVIRVMKIPRVINLFMTVYNISHNLYTIKLITKAAYLEFKFFLVLPY